MSSLSHFDGRRLTVQRQLDRRAVAAGRAQWLAARPAPPPAPVRTGTASLVLLINGESYSCKKVRPIAKGSQIWALRKLTGARAGSAYCVAKFKGQVDCTCPDRTIHGCKCKHIKAIIAVGLMGKYRSALAPAPSKGGA
ncbi:MAG: hypothetical protein WKF75_05625 [Singulisphaera sp.]